MQKVTENQNTFSEMIETFDKLDMGVIRIDGFSRLTYSNPFACRILKRNREDLEGRELRDVIPAAAALQLAGELADAQAEDRGADFEIYCPEPDHRRLRLRCVPSGKGAVIFFEDVTQVKGMQESLRKAKEDLELRVQERTKYLRQTSRMMEEQKELLLTIIDNIPVMLAFLDSMGTVRLVNKEFERVAGWSLEEARRMNLVAALFPDSSYRKEVWEFMMKTRPGWRDFKLTTRSGKVLDSSWANVRLSDGSMIGIGIDISERKRIERQILEVQKMEAVGNLAGGIASNLKNAFTPILIDTEVLMEDFGESSPFYPILQEIMESTRHGIDLVRHLLIFSRRTPQQKRPLDLAVTVREALNFLRASLPSTIEIQSRLHVESAPVLADSTQIKQVLINLAGNAGYSMGKQGGTLEVDLDRRIITDRTEARGISPDLAPGAYVSIRVRDMGQGMDEETLKHIFEPFFSTKGGHRGTGLGLSVVHGIVKSHNGAVTVESEPGKGTTFTVLLPELDRKADRFP